jgi:hypothetical protein
MDRIEDFQDRVNQLHKEIEINGGKLIYLIEITKIENSVVESVPKWGTLSIEGDKHKNGYAPTYPQTTKIETKVYTQVTRSLNLENVVKAVNGI